MTLSNRLHRPNLPSLKLQIPAKKEEAYYVSSIYDSPKHKQDITLYPSVKSIDSLQEFFTYLGSAVDFSKKTLVVFDIDEVLLHKRKISVASPENIRVIDMSETALVSDTDKAIHELSRYADVICLTARSKCSDTRLIKYNIDLLTSHNEIILTDSQTAELNKFGYSYKENTIYTDCLEKGTALKTFYSFSTTPYDTVIFIDDSKDNCLSVTYQLYDYKSDINIEAFNLTAAGYDKPCSISLDGYHLKDRPYFHSNSVANEELAATAGTAEASALLL